jgi:hypothetical protein
VTLDGLYGFKYDSVTAPMVAILLELLKTREFCYTVVRKISKDFKQLSTYKPRS